jgi:hypothetical protein
VRAGTRVLVTAHHPLTERRAHDGKLLTINGTRTMEALASRRVMGVLSGHVHDAFDLTEETAAGPLRMIGAGTLSKRIRSSPPSFNEIVIDGDVVHVTARNLERTADHAANVAEAVVYLKEGQIIRHLGDKQIAGPA